MNRFFNSATVICVISAIVFIGASNSGYAQVERDEQLRLLTAVGNAEIRVRPDQAEVRLGVETEAPTATQARDQNAALVNKVIAAIKALGISEQNIQTSVFQLTPVRRFPTSDQTGVPPIVAYNATNIVNVRTDNLDLVPRIIDEGIRAGANRVEGVNFALRNENVPQQIALKQAVENATENARAMASQLKVSLVQVQSVRQGGLGVVSPPVFFRAAAPEAGAATPILPGEITVTASATVTYLIR